MSHIHSNVVYENTFSDSTIDHASRIHFTVPSNVRTILIDFWQAGGQTGADNPILMRMNDSTSFSYCNARKYWNGTSYLSATSVTDTSMQVFTANTNEPNRGCSQVTFHTRNGSLGGDAIPYGQVLYHGATTAGFPLETRLIRALDSVNPMATFQIFSQNSTAVSFSMRVRYVR